MAYRSDAQRRKFQELAREGKISQETISKFDKASEGKKLPERVKPKKATAPMSLAELKKVIAKKNGR